MNKPESKRDRTRTTTGTPRGLRNCNPLNLRRANALWQGLRKEQTDPEFLQFRDMEWGYRAAFVTLRTYCRKYGADTPRRIIARWAPETDGNDTEAYLQRIVVLSGLEPDYPLDPEQRTDMVRLVAAMSRVENGVPPDMREVKAGWVYYLEGRAAPLPHTNPTV